LRKCYFARVNKQKDARLTGVSTVDV